MPTSHRTPAVLLLPVLLAGGACAGSASAQATFEFTDSGQALGNLSSTTVALGDLDGDGDLDAMVANVSNQPNTVWNNTITGTGVCCASSGCTLMTENLSGLCEALGGTFLSRGSCDDCPASCPGDIDGDGEVGPQDLALLLGYWGACP